MKAAGAQARFVKASLFRAAAIERWKDAETLHVAGRFQGAIYLRGYALECELKFCICGRRRVARIEESEARRLGHTLPELMDAAGLNTRLSRESDLYEAFQAINAIWSIGLRYSGRTSSLSESEGFRNDCRALLLWLRTESKS